MVDLLNIIITTIFLATILNIILKKVHIPTIIGYIFTGLIVSLLFGIKHNHTLHEIAEFGIVFLMFTIGLEFSIEHLNKMKKYVFGLGFAQVMIVGGIFSLSAEYIFGLPNKTAIIIGVAMALSSTAIVLKLLNENGQIESDYGKKTLGILIFQDIAVIPILLMITIFTNTDKEISELLLDTAVSAAIALSILFVMGKYVAEPFLKSVVETKSPEIFIGSVLLIVIAASTLAHALGFSYSLGAFLAGMMLAETKYKYQVEADLIPFRDLLLGLFFVTVGMQIDLNTITNHYGTILLLLVGIMSIKALAIMVIVYIFSKKKSSSLKTALAISQVGEFSLAILALASANNLIDSFSNQILIVTIVLSMVITPFILKNLDKIKALLLQSHTETNDIHVSDDKLNHHVIVCGYGHLGKNIVKRLQKMDIKYIVVDFDIKIVEDAQKEGIPIIFGNSAQQDVLKHLNIEKSIAAIVAIENLHNLHLVLNSIYSLNKNINIVTKVNDEESIELLQEYNLKHILNSSDEISRILIDEAMSCNLVYETKK
jgi:CPA2 family monovalent cation:H+ antiporter-2